MPCRAAPDAVPKTWRTMDGVLGYWQGLGVDGFRCDMAHMVPMQFWRWAVKRCRDRDKSVFFCAEAYDNDPAKLTDDSTLTGDLGIDSVSIADALYVLEDVFDVSIANRDLANLRTLGDLKKFLRSKLANGPTG